MEESHRKKLETVPAGTRTAVNLGGLDPACLDGSHDGANGNFRIRRHQQNISARFNGAHGSFAFANLSG